MWSGVGGVLGSRWVPEFAAHGLRPTVLLLHRLPAEAPYVMAIGRWLNAQREQRSLLPMTALSDGSGVRGCRVQHATNIDNARLARLQSNDNVELLSSSASASTQSARLFGAIHRLYSVVLPLAAEEVIVDIALVQEHHRPPASAHQAVLFGDVKCPVIERSRSDEPAKVVPLRLIGQRVLLAHDCVRLCAQCGGRTPATACAHTKPEHPRRCLIMSLQERASRRGSQSEQYDVHDEDNTRYVVFTRETGFISE